MSTPISATVDLWLIHHGDRYEVTHVAPKYVRLKHAQQFNAGDEVTVNVEINGILLPRELAVDRCDGVVVHLRPMGPSKEWVAKMAEIEDGQSVSVGGMAVDAGVYGERASMALWERCMDAGCIVVPLRVYSRWGEDGNESQDYFIGVRFIALECFDGVTGPDFYFEIEESLSGDYMRFNTPEEAIADFEKRHPRYPKSFQAAENEPLYLLQNCTAGYVGNSPVFWSNNSGYTQWIDDAKRWTKSEAEHQIRSTRGTHTWAMWSVAEIEAAAKRTVDIQDLRKGEP